MPDLAEKIQAARDEVARLERAALHATCVDLGHKMVSRGGCNCGCEFEFDGEFVQGQCSVPVNHCERCGDCDYGENADAVATRESCREKYQDA